MGNDAQSIPNTINLLISIMIIQGISIMQLVGTVQFFFVAQAGI